MTSATNDETPFRPRTDYADFAGADPDPFADAVTPADFPQARVRWRNDRWARAVGLGGLSEEEWIRRFARFEPFDGAQPRPLAMRYHGHQFRVYNPDLGDGRGFLYAQLEDGAGRLLDFGTKGSGRTPWSRSGDGRLTLKGAVREVLATEMLEALGVYTSKTFSVIETGEELHRGDEPSPTRSAVLVRLSHSHVRFGTFQRLAYHQDDAAIARLVDHVVERYHPDLLAEEGEARVAALYSRIAERSADLAASWMAAGFVHGVLNTDNMNVTGESFDYGPWRFVPVADPAFTAAYFDHQGLYAFGRQGEAVGWNLAQLGGALSRVCDPEKLNEALSAFAPAYAEGMATRIFARLGIARAGGDGDLAFVTKFLAWMTETGAPFEQVFFDWFGGGASVERAKKSRIAELYEAPAWRAVEGPLLGYAPERPERLAHPYFAKDRPATLLIDEVEALWAPIAESDDWSAFETKLDEIAEAREGYGLAAQP